MSFTLVTFREACISNAYLSSLYLLVVVVSQVPIPEIGLSACSDLPSQDDTVLAHSTDPVEVEVIRRSWASGLFSAPLNFDENSFKFVARVDSAPMGYPPNRVRDEVAYIRSMGKSNDMISATLISNEANDLFMESTWAYTLEVEAHSYIGTSPTDLLIPRSSRNSVDEQTKEMWRKRLGLHTPKELLSRTLARRKSHPNGYKYNEVLIDGVNEHNGEVYTVKVTGIIVFLKKNSPQYGKYDLRFLEQVSEAANIPLLKVSSN